MCLDYVLGPLLTSGTWVNTKGVKVYSLVSKAYIKHIILYYM